MTSLSWLPAELHPIIMRLARADAHAYELAQVALAWSRGADSTGPLKFHQVERTPGFYDFEVTAIRPIPPVAATLFSEAVYHLRAALDNVVFHLVSTAQEEPLTPAQEKAVTMPIYDDKTAFDKKIRDLVRRGIASFDPQHQLGQRLASVQPFADGVTVPSLSPQLATVMGVAVVEAHPLALLREYSNFDKHRSIRLAAARVLVQRDDDWRRSIDGGLREVEAGTVIEVVRKGVPTEVDVSAALHVQRPDETWVPFGPELDQIARHLADVVIPTLVTGLALPGGIPPDVDLGDTGQTLLERADVAGSERAHQRSQVVMLNVLAEALAQDVRWAPVTNLDNPEQPELGSAG